VHQLGRGVGPRGHEAGRGHGGPLQERGLGGVDEVQRVGHHLGWRGGGHVAAAGRVAQGDGVLQVLGVGARGPVEAHLGGVHLGRVLPARCWSGATKLTHSPAKGGDESSSMAGPSEHWVLVSPAALVRVTEAQYRVPRCSENPCRMASSAGRPLVFEKRGEAGGRQQGVDGRVQLKDGGQGKGLHAQVVNTGSWAPSRRGAASPRPA
jgi:hypothetical protein